MTEPKTQKKHLHECKYCLKGFTTVYYRNRHESIHLPSNKNLKCHLCDYVATLKVHLDRHLNTHNDKNPKHRPFKCPESNCDYSCNQKSYLKTHQLIHAKNGQNDLNNPPSQLLETMKYFCSLCSYKTQRKSNLNQHLKTHKDNDNSNSNSNDIKPFSCPMCPFKAKGNPEVERHVTNVHLNERAFKCPHDGCEYSGKNQWNLNQHLKTHSDFKPFVCGVEDCQFRSKWAHHLSRHGKTHLPKHEEKEFKCIFCTLSFHQFSSLDIHMRSHTLEVPFSCQYCSFQGKTKGKLTQHIFQTHGIKN